MATKIYQTLDLDGNDLELVNILEVIEVIIAASSSGRLRIPVGTNMYG